MLQKSSDLLFIRGPPHACRKDCLVVCGLGKIPLHFFLDLRPSLTRLYLTSLTLEKPFYIIVQEPMLANTNVPSEYLDILNLTLSAVLIIFIVVSRNVTLAKEMSLNMSNRDCLRVARSMN